MSDKVSDQVSIFLESSKIRIRSLNMSNFVGGESILDAYVLPSPYVNQKRVTLRDVIRKGLVSFGRTAELAYPEIHKAVVMSDRLAEEYLVREFQKYLKTEEGSKIDIISPKTVVQDGELIKDSSGNSAFAVLNIPSLGNKPFVILNKDMEYLPNYSIDLFMMEVGKKSQALFDNCRDNDRVGFMEYIPRVEERVIRRNGEKDILNTYNPPKWKSVSPSKNEMPKDVEKLINFMFPIPEEREYLLQWLNMSLTRRAPTCLILSGAPGTGKNTLKKFIKALHGATNSVELAKSVFSDKFNSQLSSCTFIFCDEGEINEKSTEIIKEVLNDTISIESKGVDATRGTHVHFSFMLANNKKRNTYLTFEDRKYAPLKMTDIRLDLPASKGGLGEKFVKEFLETYSVDDAEISGKDVNWEKISRAANYIIKNHSPNFEKYPNLLYRGPMFYDICHAHMSWWQHEVLNMASVWCEHFKGKSTIGELVSWEEFVEYFNGNSWKPPFDFKYFNKEYDRVKKPLPATVFDFLKVYCHDAESKGFLVEDDKFRIHPEGIDKFVARFESILKMKEIDKKRKQGRSKELVGNEDDE